MAITLVHSNPVAVERGALRVDRKFHVGMLRYASRIEGRVLTINPIRRPDERIMDPIEIPLRDAPYDVMGVATDDRGLALPSEHARMREQLRRSSLVYGGDLGVATLCRALQIPYILILEYDLPTQIAATTLAVSGRLRRGLRTLRSTWRYVSRGIREIRAAHAVHCNGYPVYERARRYNTQCLLYLDSRMTRDMLISADQLQERLRGNSGRPLRLLFSGRYEPFKGSLDVLQVGVACLARGMDVELHCYGQGSLREAMRQLAARHPDRLHVHDSIPYPELVQRSKSFDLFVCCHVQNDPSCTYLEALGAGLPVVGYANAMWRNMCRDSQAGLHSRMSDPGEVAASVQTLFDDRGLLAELSTRALSFAGQHLFEAEFDKRIDAINSTVARFTSPPALATAQA